MLPKETVYWVTETIKSLRNADKEQKKKFEKILLYLERDPPPLERWMLVPKPVYIDGELCLRWLNDTKVLFMRVSNFVDVAKIELDPGTKVGDVGDPTCWERVSSVEELRESVEWCVPRSVCFL